MSNVKNLIFHKAFQFSSLLDICHSFSGCYMNQVRTMKANYTIEAGDVRVIRPLVYVREKSTRDFSQEVHLPVINENCPACFEEPKVCTILYCTVLYCTVLYCTVLYCTVLHCIFLHFTVLCYDALYFISQQFIILYCTVPHLTVLCCAVLCCAVLCCAVLCCAVLYLTVLCSAVLN